MLLLLLLLLRLLPQLSPLLLLLLLSPFLLLRLLLLPLPQIRKVPAFAAISESVGASAFACCEVRTGELDYQVLFILTHPPDLWEDRYLSAFSLLCSQLTHDVPPSPSPPRSRTRLLYQTQHFILPPPPPLLLTTCPWLQRALIPCHGRRLESQLGQGVLILRSAPRFLPFFHPSESNAVLLRCIVQRFLVFAQLEGGKLSFAALSI